MYNIGLIVGNIEDDFSRQVSEGAHRAAEILGDNLFVFPVKYLNFSEVIKNVTRQQFEYQYNFLLAYARSCSLDMVILCLSTIAYRTDREEYLKILNMFEDIPVFLISSEEEGYSSIMFDNVLGLKQGIQYLINSRGCKNIGMVSGPLDKKDARERLQAYREVLTMNNLVQHESMIVCGDFSEWSVRQAEELVENNPNLDAIVCANDCMAKSVYKVLHNRGIEIGKDICVLGFDDIDEAENLFPPLATVRADASVMGYQAFMEVHAMLEEAKGNKKQISVRRLKVDTKFINRESASGQKAIVSVDLEELKQTYQDKLQSMTEANHRLNILTRDMLMYYEKENGGFSNFLDAFYLTKNNSCYLFMLEEPILYYAKEDFRVVDKLYLQAYRLNDEIVEYQINEKQVCLDDLFSNRYIENKAKTYMIIDIYSREKQYGIMVCDMTPESFPYVENICYQIGIATKMIELLHVQEILLAEKEVMVQKLAQENLILDNISNKDELTGIYNRRGFITNTMDMLQNKRYLDKKAIIIYADLNYLKLINDRYSHAEGNYALQACAKILDGVTCEEYVAGRIGGDEFALFCILENGMDGTEIKKQLKQSMQDINISSHKPYEIAMSIGVHEFVISKKCDLKELMKEADAMSYIEKRMKKPFVERKV